MKEGARMAAQTENGKAFEYACLQSLYNSLSRNQEVEISQSAPLTTARNCYERLSGDKSSRMDSAANSAVRVIMRLEPRLTNADPGDHLSLDIQADSKGQTGDVRDVVCIRSQSEWEIGISCKHNHKAVKHSRLSEKINFGSQWFGVSCTDQYFMEICPIFTELRGLAARGIQWCDIDNKIEQFYLPVLEAFINETRRLDCAHPNVVPGALIEYLLGRHDFYKIISIDSNRTTEIQAYNLFGTLNRNAGRIRPQSRVQRVALPTHIYDIRLKPDSETTAIITCDNGWAVSLRIHNADKIVEPSLKFDVNLVGTPPVLGSIIEPWL